MLELKGVTTYYGEIRILTDVHITVGEGELVCLLGGNASGKSTTIKTILGLVKPRRGSVILKGQDVTRMAVCDRVAMGIGVVPENRRVFGPLTVLENLELGGHRLPRSEVQVELERVYDLFPKLHERRRQAAGTLSGGEQQMLAVGRALMSRPSLLLMDEPSMGLSPALVEQNFAIIADIHKAGLAMLVVEQNANMALAVADRGYVLQTGEVVLSDTAATLAASDDLKRAYLGV